jgi:ferredoxin
MVKISVDHGKCTGHARCHATAAEIYPIDDDGYVAIDGGITVEDAHLALAEAGAAACPERAITVTRA